MLFFGIGVSGAIVCTLIYALPPLIRIAGYGIRTVSTTTIEATDSAGQTSWQRLLKVQIPMARKTIIVGLNQTTMAALSMAIIASYVDGPGLGKPVLAALVRNDVGGAIVPGLLIVAIAIMLDRTTTAASEASELAARGQVDLRPRQVVLAVTGVIALVAVCLSRSYPDAREFPETTLGTDLADWLDGFTDVVHRHLRRRHRAVQGLHHRRAAQPAAGAAGRVAVVRHRPPRSSRSPSSSAGCARWSRR